MFHTGLALGKLGNLGDIEKHRDVQVYPASWGSSEQYEKGFLYFLRSCSHIRSMHVCVHMCTHAHTHIHLNQITQ